MREGEQRGHAVRGFLTIGTLYSYLYCTLTSNVLFSMPILGGALYLAGQTALLFGTLRRPAQEGVVSKSMRRLGTGLLVALLLLLLFLMTVYPIRLDSADFWRLAGIVLCIVLRPALTNYVVERALLSHQKTMGILLRIGAVQLLFLPLLLSVHPALCSF